jgi:HEAT repeat
VTRTFENPEPISRADAEAKLRSPDAKMRVETLLAIAYHDPDWRWVQDRCLDMLDDPHVDVRAMAALCLGHVVRIHPQLDLDRVLPALTAVLSADVVGSRARDALVEIEVFITGRH